MKGNEPCPSQVTSVAGLLRMLTGSLMPKDYSFYAVGSFKDERQARSAEFNIINKYKIVPSKDQRHGRKKKGLANVRLLRYRTDYVIFATPGSHFFYENESHIYDVRMEPLECLGYSISFIDGHSCVSLSLETEKTLRSYFLAIALKRKAPRLAQEFRSLPWLPYAPVRAQLLSILTAVNERRKKAGYQEVPASAIRRRIPVCRPFDWRDADYDPAEDVAPVIAA